MQPDHLNPTILSPERTIAGMEQQIEKLKEERDELAMQKHVLIKVGEALTEERDQWRQCAEELYNYIHNDATGYKDRLDVLAAYDRLTREAKAKGGGE